MVKSKSVKSVKPVKSVKSTKALSKKKPGKIKPNRGVWTARPTPSAGLLVPRRPSRKESLAFAHKVVDFLNSALAIDKAAVGYAMMHRVQCNEAIRNHPTIQSGTQHGSSHTSALGILNGICGISENGVSYIAAELVESYPGRPAYGCDVEKFSVIDHEIESDSVIHRKVKNSVQKWTVTMTLPKGIDSKKIEKISIEKSVGNKSSKVSPVKPAKRKSLKK